MSHSSAGSKTLLSGMILVLALALSAQADSLSTDTPQRPGAGWRLIDTQTDNEITEGMVFSLATAVFLDDKGILRNSWDTAITLQSHDLPIINSRREDVPEVRFTGFANSADSAWFICGERGVLLQSNNWGKLWKQRYFPGLDSLYFYDILFANGRNGLLVGVTGGEKSRYKGIIYRTEDGGNTWKSVDNVSGIGFSHISYIPDKKRYYVTGAGVFVYSDDWGKTWTTVRAPDGNLLRATLFEGLKGLAVGMGGRMLTSLDAGGKWEEIKSPTTNHLVNAFRWNPGYWYLAGNNGEVWETTDHGETWNNLALPKEVMVNGVMRVGPKLFAWGANGTVAALRLEKRLKK